MKNVGDLLKELQELKTVEQAKHFWMTNHLENTNLWSNMKYIVGYLDTHERTRILNLFRGIHD